MGDRGRQGGRALLQRLNDERGRAAAGLLGRLHLLNGGGARGRPGVHHALVHFDHRREMIAQLAQERFGRTCSRTGAGHAPRDQLQRRRIFGQPVRLAVFVELQTVFQVPQELVGLGQPAVFGAGEISLVLQTRERQHGPAVTDPGIGASVQALQALDQEFDVADAAALQLHVDHPSRPAELAKAPAGA